MSPTPDGALCANGDENNRMKNSNETNNLFLLTLIIIKRISLSPNMNLFCIIQFVCK
jgi:hypothetical protein